MRAGPLFRCLLSEGAGFRKFVPASAVLGEPITDPITRAFETLSDALVTLWLGLVTLDTTFRAVVAP